MSENGIAGSEYSVGTEVHPDLVLEGGGDVDLGDYAESFFGKGIGNPGDRLFKSDLRVFEK